MCSSQSAFDVLCIGHAAWDLVFTVDGAIAEDQKYRANDLVQSGGGPASNAACLLARWGLSVALAGHVGADSFGTSITHELDVAGVNTTFLRRIPNDATPISCVLVNRDSGSRTIVNYRPEPRRTAAETDLPVAAPRAILCDGHEPALTSLAINCFPNALTVLDAGSYRDATHDLAQRVAHAVVSSAFATAATGIRPDTPEAALRCLVALGEAYSARVAITLGARGVAAFDDQGTPLLLEPPVVRAVDTTAAGDIFHGAFVWALLSGRHYLASIRAAMRTAALSVAHAGGRSSIPDLAPALAFSPEWYPEAGS